MAWPLVAAVAAPYIMGALSYMGQQETNKTNVDIANRTNAFNAEEAEKNRVFQEGMSSTAHQREARDLQNAGLNPLLTGNGGASSPSGSAASGVSAHVENSLQSGLASAMSFKQLQLQVGKQEKELELMDAQKRKTLTEEKVLQKGIPESELKNDVYDVIRPYVKKIKEAAQSSSKYETPKEQRVREYMKDFDQRQKQLQLRKD